MNFGYRRRHYDDDEETIDINRWSHHQRLALYAGVLQAQVVGGNPSLPPTLTVACRDIEIEIAAIPLYTGDPMKALLVHKDGAGIPAADMTIISKQLEGIRDRLAWEGVEHVKKMYPKWEKSNIRPQISRSLLTRAKVSFLSRSFGLQEDN